MTLKVYGMAVSTCTSRVLATIFEKKVSDYKLVPVTLMTGEHTKPEYLAIQPFGLIPALQDGEFTIFESRAIARYIALKYEGQGTPLYGKTLAEKAKVEQWLEVESQNFLSPASTIAMQLAFGPMSGQAPNEEIVKSNIEKLEKVLDIYDEHLSKNEYLAGNFFSLADLSHLPSTHYLIAMAKKGDLITCRKHVNAWWEKISARPAWKKVLELQAAQWLIITNERKGL